MAGLTRKALFSKANALEYIATAFPLVGSQIAAGVPWVLAYVILGSTGDIVSVTVLGLSLTFENIFAFAFIISVTEIAGAACAKAYGAGNYRRMASFFYKSVLSLIVINSLYYLSIAWAYDVLIFLNLEPAIAERGVVMIRTCWYFLVFESFNHLIRAFLMSQDVMHMLNYISTGSILWMILVGKYFIIDCGYKELGYAYARLIQELLTFGILIYVTITKSHKETLVVPTWSLVKEDFGQFIKKGVYSLFAVYGEFMAFEVNTFLASQLKNLDQMAAWLTFASLSLIFYFTSLGFSNTFRTRIGQGVGEGKVEQARHKSILYYLYTLFISVVMGIAAFIFAPEIAQIFINNAEITPMVTICIRIMCTYVYPFLILYTFFAIFRILNMDKYFFNMITFVFPIMNLVFGWFFALALGMGLYGIVVGMSVSNNLIACIFFAKVYWQTNWEAEISDDKRVLMMSSEFEL
jgi:Na+-driven multidrug efflux pump